MQRVDASAVSEEEAAASAALKAAKLDTVDKLLWGAQAKRSGTASSSGMSATLNCQHCSMLISPLTMRWRRLVWDAAAG